jgi:hypothetical protein
LQRGSLEGAAKLTYSGSVQHRSYLGFQNLPRAMMLLAAAAFLLQSLVISMSQAAAAVGFIPEPAVALHGSMHYHDNLAGHVHHHGGDNASGHVHDSAPLDSSDVSSDFDGSSWTLFCACLAIPTIASLHRPAALASRLERPKPEAAVGIFPPNLIRPPSTPSIA